MNVVEAPGYEGTRAPEVTTNWIDRRKMAVQSGRRSRYPSHLKTLLLSCGTGCS
ncbi:hypothetical protein OH76DRAFT_176014 [Lentinus brumalis]|uniref:Uncharacterized protein n=1 Tax=Lentinus brumalis TaxID=2498619 RepID=A0A371CNJ2_9APHY|nr:hypothetical protein OH76DRAFT_176014 [Polyporus brumalis]